MYGLILLICLYLFHTEVLPVTSDIEAAKASNVNSKVFHSHVQYVLDMPEMVTYVSTLDSIVTEVLSYGYNAEPLDGIRQEIVPHAKGACMECTGR